MIGVAMLGELTQTAEAGFLSAIDSSNRVLPICSFCKKILDEKGNWQRIELYLLSYAGSVCSHSICPVCMKKHSPEYVD